MELDVCQKRLARIRGVHRCIDNFKNGEPFPKELCFVPAEVEYSLVPCGKLAIYSEPDASISKKIGDLKAVEDFPCRIVASGEEFCNAEGQWLRVLKKCIGPVVTDVTKDGSPAWCLLYSAQTPHTANISGHLLIPVDGKEAQQQQQSAVAKKNRSSSSSSPSPSWRRKEIVIADWDQLVEYSFALKISPLPPVVKVHEQASERLSKLPPKWRREMDEALVRFLYDKGGCDNINLANVKDYIESVEVSTSCDEDDKENLLDGDPNSYWESDGNQGAHWVRLQMKTGVVIRKMLVSVDSGDDNYMPNHIQVMGGIDKEHLQLLANTKIESTFTGDVCILEDAATFYPCLEIRIKECKDEGIDTRLHGIKIKSSRERDAALNCDNFTSENLIRYPLIESFDHKFLYRRALVLQRFINLVDSVLPHLVPKWEHSIGTFDELKWVRQLLPLSKKRMSLVETFLHESETPRPGRMPKLYINRRAAADHKSDPSLDSECKNTVFTQIYEGLKPQGKTEKPMDFRWPAHYEQWWECKFLAEGIIDQGGGFRDSLSDIADELCPSDCDALLPLPFFTRSPNQSSLDSNVNRDVYVPNPSCDLFTKFEFIGKLMGACFRGREHLVLALPQFIWKRLVGEEVTWERDYLSIDADQVRFTDSLENVTRDKFEDLVGKDMAFAAVLSDGSVKELKDGGGEIKVTFDNRLDFLAAVKKVRLKEFDKQIAALQRGLLSVVPQAVLDLMTWQEMEQRICGDPEISLEGLKKATHYDDLNATDQRVVYLWEALEKFTNEDRSRFLRFVTGRRRLPTPMYVCADRGEIKDALPESSTCSNTLFLPAYSTPKIAEEKLRYAAYNCIAIDTDMSPWDE